MTCVRVRTHKLKMKVLLTGPFGNVGSNVVQYILETNAKLGRGDHPDRITLTCLDKKSPMSEASYNKIQNTKIGKQAISEGALVVIWGDLTNAEDVKKAVDGQDAIIHLGAVIPPTAYVHLALARKVNVDGTRLLVEAGNALGKIPRFIFASSYSVQGPRNPNKDLPLVNADTPVNPQDSYAKHKIECETMIRVEYKGEWAILRLGAISATLGVAKYIESTEILNRISVSVPGNQKRHAVHSKDVAVAFINATKSNEVNGKTLMIGGDETWKITCAEFYQTVYGAIGIKYPFHALRKVPDTAADEAYYYEHWMDTTESQQLLKFQNHTRQDWANEVRAEAGIFICLAASIFSPLIANKIASTSRHYKYNKAGKPDPLAELTVIQLIMGEDYKGEE